MKQNQAIVGVGVIALRNGLVLLGKRKGSHGTGTWALRVPLTLAKNKVKSFGMIGIPFD